MSSRLLRRVAIEWTWAVYLSVSVSPLNCISLGNCLVRISLQRRAEEVSDPLTQTNFNRSRLRRDRAIAGNWSPIPAPVLCFDTYLDDLAVVVSSAKYFYFLYNKYIMGFRWETYFLERWLDDAMILLACLYKNTNDSRWRKQMGLFYLKINIQPLNADLNLIKVRSGQKIKLH